MAATANIVAIIIAAGSATRWGNHMGVPKHLIVIEGEPILYRTVRLLKERGVKNIYVVGPPDDPRYEVPGSKLYIPTKDRSNHDADKFLNSSPLWNLSGRTIVFYGDVYFTEEAMDTIINWYDMKWTLFARFGASKFTGTKWGECFAQSFYPQAIPKHRDMLIYIAALMNDKVIRRCGGWEHYRAMNGAREKNVSKHIKYKRLVEIDDWSDDFDYAQDYDRWIENRKKHGLPY